MTAKYSKQSRRGEAHKLAYSYRRFSSQNQSNNTSLERQLEDAQEVCSEKGWTLIDLPPDAGVSAFKGANIVKGTLGTFLKKVKQGEVSKGSVLIIEKLDRFSRNEIDLVIPDFLSLLQSGVEIFSCVDKTHYTLADIRRNPMMLNYAVMAMAMANDYSKSLGNRITKSFDIRLAQCQKGHKMNLGSWKPYWIDFIGEEKQPGSFKLNDHAETIERIVTEYLDGRSMYQIARGLIADKVPTLLGGKWAQGTVANLLRHQCLLGDVTIKGQLLRGYFPAVITEAQQKKLDAKLNENRQRKGGDGASDYVANLFRNRCKCSHCGGTITTAKSSSERLYTCKTKRVGQCPSKYSVKVSEVELDFFLLYLQQSPETLLNKNTDEHANKVAQIQSQIARWDKDIGTLLDVGLDMPELKTKLAELKVKRETAKGDLEKLNASMLSTMNTPKALTDVKAIVQRLLKSKGQNIDKATFDFQKVANTFEKSLQDNSIRKTLLALLPSIIHHLIIDTTKGAYCVVSHDGRKSLWRKVVV
jgi:DNA invertase Pin-like site-specific DNA recombinase